MVLVIDRDNLKPAARALPLEQIEPDQIDPMQVDLRMAARCDAIILVDGENALLLVSRGGGQGDVFPATAMDVLVLDHMR